MNGAARKPPIPQIGTPTEQDVVRLVESMVSGFGADPLYEWLYPDVARRPRSLRATFEQVLRCGLERGIVRCTEDLRSVSIWTPPDVDLLGVADLDAWLQRLRVEAPTRVDPAVAAMAECARHAPDEPHWVLHLVVVDASHQGQGLGSALLRSTLGDVDASGAVAYLESSNLRNVSAYRRLGFEVVGEVAITGGPTMRPMVRPPAGHERR